MVRGKYIVIEGSDGTGKSTQVTILREKLNQQGIESIEFHEPAGLPIANSIREIILNGKLPRRPETNLLLFTAARHELWHDARQKLDQGIWIVTSRNYFSTLAYQGYAEGLNREQIVNLTREFTDETYMKPDMAVILTLEDEAEREARIGSRGKLATLDTFESKGAAFQRAIQDGYLQIAKEYDIPLVSSHQSPAEVAAEIYNLLPPAST